MKKALHVNYPEFEIDSVIDEDLEKELQKITYDKITSSSTSRTIKNIRKNLSATLKAKYDINDTERLNEVTSKILKIHGLHEDNFDFVKKFEDGLLERINDFSIDDNSNKNEKVMRGYLNEVEKPVDKLIGYDVLYRTLKDLYGEKEAKRLTGEMYDYSLGLSDSSNILVPYCWSLDASKLVTQGRNFGVLPSKPCKRVSSYISSLCETIHQMSNHLAGACLHKSAGLIIDSDNCVKYINIKDLIDSIGVDQTYNNYQGCWEYKDISDKNLKVLENNSNFVKINKIMRRKYDKDIYNITTASGLNIKCSEDHKFKVLYKGRELEVPAKDLYLYDTIITTAYNDIPVDKSSEDYLKGRMVGLIVGDGTINEHDVRLSVNYEQTYISDFCSDYIKNHNMGEGRLLNGHGCYDYHMTKKYVKPIIDDIEGLRAEDKNINIKDKSLDYLAGFMDGYMLSDGYYNGSLGISSINKKLIETVVEICKIFGIKVSDIKEGKRGKGSFKPDGIDYKLNISLNLLKYLDLFEEKVKQSSIHKHPKGGFKRLNTINYVGVMGLGNSRVLSLNSKPVLYKNSRGSEYTSKPYRAISEQFREELKLSHTDTIISIEKESNDDPYVYEIETESHWYSVNGFLTHNCAIGTFFLDLTHILIYKERRTLNEVKTDKKIRKYIENELQQFIHSVNHLSRNGAESPFTNVSIFDSVKLKGLIDKDNYAWYFPNLKAISTDNDLDDKMSDEEFNQYVIDYIMTIQNLYMDFFEKGDPLNNGMPYRFPVSTVNFSKKEENGELVIEDSKFLKEFRKRDAFRFNLFNSTGTKICSCCFNGDEAIEIENKSGEKTITSIQDFVNIYSNNNEGEYDVNDEIFIKSLDENNEISKSKIIGVLNKKNGYNEMIDIEIGNHKISVTPDHIFKVKDKITNDIKEITAEELMNNKEKYMVPVI